MVESLKNYLSERSHIHTQKNYEILRKANIMTASKQMVCQAPEKWERGLAAKETYLGDGICTLMAMQLCTYLSKLKLHT